MSTAIQIDNLEKSYGATKALAGVTLQVPTGGVFGVVGPNGAGKTTLFSVISGFLRQDAGSVTVGGTTLEPGCPPPPGFLGVLPQDANFIRELSLGWQMEHFCRLQGLSVREAKAEVERTLALVGLPEVARKRAPRSRERRSPNRCRRTNSRRPTPSRPPDWHAMDPSGCARATWAAPSGSSTGPSQRTPSAVRPSSA